jgi:pilus assembly protein Flp/PilA
MRSVLRLVLNLARDRKGATAIEYGLILALVFLAMVGAVRGLGGATIDMWSNVSSKVQATN